MEQNPPAKRNTFVMVAVVLFNLIWLILLFLSCQADNDPKPTPTPEVMLRDSQNQIFDEDFYMGETLERLTSTLWKSDPISNDHQHFRLLAVFLIYRLPLYKPPSTCSITPVI
jgi:hypothetical protein